MMKKELNDIFIKHFSCIKDPRIERCKRHLLLDILVLSLCAVMSGAEQWIDIEAYGQEKEAWLKTFLELPNGIPSHDTIARVFASLDPIQFQQAFLKESAQKMLKAAIESEVNEFLKGCEHSTRHGEHKVRSQGARDRRALTGEAGQQRVVVTFNCWVSKFFSKWMCDFI